MRVVGAVNGKIEEYISIINKDRRSLQLGNMCSSAVYEDETKLISLRRHEERYNDRWVSSGHARLTGSRDDINAIQSSYHLYGMQVKTFMVNNQYMLGTVVSGGESKNRNQNYYQEIQISNQLDGIKTYKEYIDTNRPMQFMLTHEAPTKIAKSLGFKRTTATSHFLETLHNINPPKIWIFSRYEKSMDEVIDGTRFIGLAELQHLDIGELCLS